MNCNKQLVIAAYNANLRWIDAVPPHVTITVYKKGTPSNDSREIFLDNNIGRCVHTFFRHLRETYDNLAQFTYFAQDYPFDHWSNLIESLDFDVQQMSSTSVIQTGGYYGYNSKYFDLIPAKQVGDGRVYVSSSDGAPHHTNDGIDVDRYWSILFDGNAPLEYEFNPGGHFILTREHAMLRSKQFYSKVVELLESERIAPYTIERLENYIFNPAFKTKL